MIETLAATVERTGTTLLGPMPLPTAGPAIAARTDGAVAIPIGDPLVDDSGLLDALGSRALLPDAPDWRAQISHATAGVTGSLLAAADTGSVAVAAGPGRPRALPLIPPHHWCLVDVATIEPTFADAFVRVAATPDALPSDLIWISGPSRTGDLEMVTTVGIHGPLAVTFVLIER